MIKFKGSKTLILSICIFSASMLSNIGIKANNFDEDFNSNHIIYNVMPRTLGTTSTLPKVSSSPSTYVPITGTLSSLNYGKKIKIKVSDFTKGMDSVNMGLYVDDVFKFSEEKIIDGGSATFEFPHSGKNYQIRMSTYSSTPGTCYYSTSISD